MYILRPGRRSIYEGTLRQSVLMEWMRKNRVSSRKGKMNMYKIVKNYRDNGDLRASFNRLAGETFGLDFEDWYANGYWTDRYNPYSIVIDREVVANVSVNRMDMLMDGEVKHLLQLGTVMTREEYRNRGLIRRIMEEIDRDYGGKVDGIYLYASDSVLEFYPKFGFRKSEEYQYSKQVSMENEATVEKVSMACKAEWDVLEQAILESNHHGQPDMVDNVQLDMFYVSKFMQDTVYYEPRLDAYIIAELEDENLLLHGVFAENEVSLEEVIRAFGREVRCVTLGFTPNDTEGYECKKLQVDDCTFFVKGAALEEFDKKGIMFPTLSHA